MSDEAQDDAHEEAQALERARAWVGRTVVGKFTLVRLLGVGGMGAVYEATNAWTGRKVAVKTLLNTAVRSREAVARLQQEARAAASVAHPHILDVLDMYRDDEGNFFIVTELLVGEPLEALLHRSGRVDPYRSVELIVPVAAALAAAHRGGVVHRDVKPANIFLHSDGAGQLVPKVIDFGVSKVSDERVARTRTRTGAIIGTVDYMSPEQARGESTVDAQTDVWALGVVLFRMLTGALPFDGPTFNVVMINIATKRAPRVRDLVPSVPEALAAAVDRALEPERSARHASMTALLRALLAWADPLRAPSLTERYRAALPALEASALLRSSVAPAPLAQGALTPPSFSSASDATTPFEDPPTVAIEKPTPATPTQLEWQRPTRSGADLAPASARLAPARSRAPVLALGAGAALVAASALAFRLIAPPSPPATGVARLTAQSTRPSVSAVATRAPSVATAEPTVVASAAPDAGATVVSVLPSAVAVRPTAIAARPGATPRRATAAPVERRPSSAPAPSSPLTIRTGYE